MDPRLNIDPQGFLPAVQSSGNCYGFVPGQVVLKHHVARPDVLAMTLAAIVADWLTEDNPMANLNNS